VRAPSLRAAARRVAAAPWSALAPVGLAVGLWLAALPEIDARAMSDLGLVSVLPPAFFAGLVVLTAGFAVALRRPGRSGVLATHLVVLIALLHATPALVYGTLRYSWAWKHVGIVDYIERHGSVATDIDYLGVYHNWPGFFGFDALLAQLSSVGDIAALASWGPPVFNLLNLAALVFLFSAITADRRVVWLGAWLFFVAAWVGQDYFSPQAFAFFLYVVLLGVVVRWLGPSAPGRPRPAPVVLALLLLAVIAVSHPLTSVMAALALGALTVAGACRVRWLPFAAAGMTVAWNLLFARPFVDGNLAATIDSINLPWATTQTNLTSAAVLSDGQQLVSTLSRTLVLAMVALACAGALRELRAGRLHRGAAVLAAVPILLFATGGYDGEVIFRIYLFALPGLALFAAFALVARRPPVFAAVSLAVLGLFLFAYYGKERQYHFTPGEVAAARHLYSVAPPGTLLIEGTRNYPGQFANYERFRYVALSREPTTSFPRFLADPEKVFAAWMADPANSAAYLVITRSMKAEVAEAGVMPPGSLDRIERALLDSPRFRVELRNRDATVFTLARPPAAPPLTRGPG
jgi:hypothetical protein